MTDELITEEQLKRVIEEYGNHKYLVDSLKSTLQTALDTILQKYPEARKEYEELLAELGEKLEKAEEKEKQIKKTLDLAIEAFCKTAPIKDKLIVRSNLAKVSLTKEVRYDAKALDGMAIQDPRLLAFRSEEIKSRVTLNSK